MAASNPSYFADFEHVNIFSSHFVDFEQVKKLVVILLTLNMSKFLVVILQTLNNSYRFINFLIIVSYLFFILYKEKSKTFL